MRFALILVLGILMANSALAADQPQAREVARMNNCPPKKIEVYTQTLGTEGNTIYRVDCNMPKGKGEQGPTSNAILVSCDQSVCQLLRTLPPEGK
jgi:hypothetical protein